MYSICEGLTFDDLLLIPKHSMVMSRSDVDLSVKVKDLTFKHPIIPANMQSITGEKMAEAVIRSEGLALIHRFMDLEEQLQIINNLSYKKEYLNHIGVSVGIKDCDKDKIKRFIDIGVKIFCIDIAHGDSTHGINMTRWIRNNYPNVLIISGNVATKFGAKILWQSGADIVKVNIGAGSICTTRIETGNGVPQMTALMNAYSAKEEFELKYNRKVYIISDGGAKSSGDIVKSLCFADMFMSGNMFSGCVETPGSILSISNKTCKEYRGSSTHKSNHIEGVVAIIPTKGKFENILKKLLEGIRSGCSYQNAHNLNELKESPEFIKITNAGLVESNIHDIQLM